MPTWARQATRSVGVLERTSPLGRWASALRTLGAKDFDPVAVEFHRQATDAVREILFTDAEKVRPTI